MNILLTFGAVAVALVGIPVAIGKAIRHGMGNDTGDLYVNPGDADTIARKDDWEWDKACLLESRTLEPRELPSRRQP